MREELESMIAEYRTMADIWMKKYMESDKEEDLIRYSLFNQFSNDLLELYYKVN